MDTLYWTKISPSIHLKYTTKQFFSKYTWKLVCKVPGSRTILSNSDIGEAIRSRMIFEEFYRYNVSWFSSKDKLSNSNVPLLEALRSLKNTTSLDIKIRVEEPYVTFYADNEYNLKEIVMQLHEFDLDFILEIHGPKNEKNKEILKSGAILVKNNNGFRYKVILRTGPYDPNTKLQILNFLDNLKEEVKLNAGGRRILSEPFPHVWGVFFYTNDKSIMTFLNLISPNVISNIHELVYE